MKYLKSTAIALSIVFATFGAAAQETNKQGNACFERGALIKHLDGKFDEAPVAAGLAANGSVLEVFTSPDGITWTIVLTQPNGATCVMASGESWMGIPAPIRGTVS